MSGPVPKRESQRRRRNKTEGVDRAEGARVVRAPRADPKWNPIARAWFNSLGRSGQSKFYEPSDWALAVLIAESISRDLEPQFVGMTDDGEVIKERLPLKGASLAGYLKGMTSLLVTEGDRRRLRLELEKPGPTPAAREDPRVARMSEYRSRFTG